MWNEQEFLKVEIQKSIILEKLKKWEGLGDERMLIETKRVHKIQISAKLERVPFGGDIMATKINCILVEGMG